MKSRGAIFVAVWLDHLRKIFPSDLRCEELVHHAARPLITRIALAEVLPEESRGFAVPTPVEPEAIDMKTPSQPPAPRVIGVGIDTARYGHQVTFLRDDRQVSHATATCRGAEKRAEEAALGQPRRGREAARCGGQ